MRRTTQTLLLGLTGCALAGGAWWAMATEPFTWHARIATAAGGLLALGAGLVWRRLDPPTTPSSAADRHGGSHAIWAVLTAAVVGFQLHMFTEQPRQLYPTVSSLVDTWLQPHPVRAAGFLLWMALGVYLLRR